MGGSVIPNFVDSIGQDLGTPSRVSRFAESLRSWAVLKSPWTAQGRKPFCRHALGPRAGKSIFNTLAFCMSANGRKGGAATAQVAFSFYSISTRLCRVDLPKFLFNFCWIHVIHPREGHPNIMSVSIANSFHSIAKKKKKTYLAKSFL